MNTRKVLFWSLTVSLGGFLFGFDTAVISGAEQSIQKLWGLSAGELGVTVGSAIFGTIFGALFGGIPTDRFGRKKTLFWIGILFLVSAIGSALAPDNITLMIARIIGGIGIGASSVAAPVYISEIAPKEKRGQLTALFQFNLVFGILIAFVSNYFISKSGFGGEDAWRWMLGLEVIPALIFVLMMTQVPRSPRWLVVKEGNVAEARTVLAAINPNTVEASLADIQASDVTKGSSIKEFFSGKYSLPILLAFLLAFFNQASGINAIIYYAPRIFEAAGMDAQSGLYQTMGIGAVNLVFTMLGLYLIDKAGRKTLMIIGSIGYIISLAMMSSSFFQDSLDGLSFWVFAFIASHAIGQGAVIWVFISEIFPNEVRGSGMALGSGTHWVFAWLITTIFPYFQSTYGGGKIFAFFAVMMVVQLIWVLTMMPETKGVSLEDLQKRLAPKA